MYNRLQPRTSAYNGGSTQSLLEGATTSTPRLGYSQSGYSLGLTQGAGFERREHRGGLGMPELERARSRIRHLEKEVEIYISTIVYPYFTSAYVHVYDMYTHTGAAVGKAAS